MSIQSSGRGFRGSCLIFRQVQKVRRHQRGRQCRANAVFKGTAGFGNSREDRMLLGDFCFGHRSAIGSRQESGDDFTSILGLIQLASFRSKQQVRVTCRRPCGIDRTFDLNPIDVQFWPSKRIAGLTPEILQFTRNAVGVVDGHTGILCCAPSSEFQNLWLIRSSRDVELRDDSRLTALRHRQTSSRRTIVIHSMCLEVFHIPIELFAMVLFSFWVLHHLLVEAILQKPTSRLYDHLTRRYLSRGSNSDDVFAGMLQTKVAGVDILVPALVVNDSKAIASRIVATVDYHTLSIVIDAIAVRVAGFRLKTPLDRRRLI